MRGDALLQVRIVSLNVDTTSNQPVIILRPADETGDLHHARLLPIWIGQAEATAILLAIQGAEPPRPMTHDLLSNVIQVLGFLVTRIEITRLEQGTFYAAIVLRGEEREVVVDARPSDSIALAVRVGCPIYCAEQVMNAASVVPEEEAGEDEEDEVKRFREFLEQVDPSDFMPS